MPEAILSDLEWQALQLSVFVAFWAIALSLPLAYFAAYALARWRFPGKLLVDGVIHLPLVLPPVVVGFLLLTAFGRRGALGGWLYDSFGITVVFTWKAAAIAAAVMAFPLMVRVIRIAIETIDPGLLEAASVSGAAPLDRFFSITLPLSLRGIVSGAALGFSRALGEFGATIVFAANIPGETQTLPLAIYTALQAPGGEEAAMRLSMLAVAVALIALLISEIGMRRELAR